MSLLFPAWMKIIFFYNDLKHFALYKYAMRLNITSGYFNILVYRMQRIGLVEVVVFDGRSKRLLLTVAGEKVFDNIRELEEAKCFK